MTAALGVERAFQDLETAPPLLQGLLRPVLVRALRDPAIMRQLGSSTALSQHLTVLGRVLTSEPLAETTNPGTLIGTDASRVASVTRTKSWSSIGRPSWS